MPDDARATTPAQRCPDCGAVLVKDFDEDCGRYWRCDGCDFRASANAAPARPPQRTIEDAIAEAEHLLQETFDRLDPDHADGGWLITRIAKIREALADRPSGRRAAGAATPPATPAARCEESDAAYEAIAGPVPSPAFRKYAGWVSARKAFRAGWDARGALAAGAGAATPALSAEEHNARDRVEIALGAALRPFASDVAILVMALDRLTAAPAATAGGVAAAPSPPAQQRDPNVGDVTGYPPTIVYQPGTEGRTALAESSTEGFREIHPDRSAPSLGPQRKEPTPP